jgi:hypothetical protein
MRKKLIPVNETGHRIGEGHHKATLPDSVVRYIRDLHEYDGLGYRKIAKMLKIPRATVQHICNYTRRAQVAHRWIRDEREEAKEAD